MQTIRSVPRRGFYFILLKTLIMQKFKLSWMALLRNDEHAQLIEQLCGILDDRPVENPYVTKAAAKVKLHLPALRCVGSESRKHELTGVLEELSEKRRRTLISLDMRVKAALWSPLTEESEPAEVLRFWLDKQGKRLVKGSRIAQTRRVNEMLRDVADDASLRKALEALHLMPLVESLRETNDAFGATFLKRNDDWARKEKSNRRVIRKSVDEAVKLLMGMLASFAELDGQSGYAELIGELDRLLVYYRRTVAVRKGRRSAAKERAKSREHRSNADMQSGREELDIQGMQGGREKQDTQKPLPDVAEEQRREQSACRERTSSSLAVAKVQRGEDRESRERREHREGREYKERSKSREGIETSSFPDKANIS